MKALFTAYCDVGTTASGKRTRELTCAAPKEIPFGTKIKVSGTGTSYDGKIYEVTDRGGKVNLVNGVYHFDLWIPSRDACIKFGSRNGTAYVVDSNTYSESVDTASGRDIIDIASGEVGYRETGNNMTKYGAWYGMNGAAWCHMFASWCACQAGVSTSIFPRTASTSVGMKWFQDHGLFKYKGSYTPKRGDVVYFKTGRSHVGLVEYVSCGTLHTIEGNSSSKVARRTYSLSEQTITGYGTPEYVSLNTVDTGSGSGSSKKKTKVTSKRELAYLNKILSMHSEKLPAVTDKEVKETNHISDGKISVLVNNGKNKFYVPVKDGARLTWERRGVPGKFDFDTKSAYSIDEGNSILVTVDGVKMFYGFVFIRSMTKDGFMSITAYDQLRYLKNKECIIYKKKTATEVIEILAKRFNLNCGKLVDTKYRMSAVEDSKSLFDIINDNLGNTSIMKETVYVLYDDVGKLTLKDVVDMKINSCLIDEETAENYTYKTSIDSDVYNQVKLVFENKEKGTYDLYVSKDSSHINKWGVLQFTEKIDAADSGKLKSQAYLKLYNQKTKNLSISGVIGNTHVRAGSLVPVILKLSDMKVSNYLLVEKVTHTFNNKQHTMDLTLSGGGFSA